VGVGGRALPKLSVRPAAAARPGAVELPPAPPSRAGAASTSLHTGTSTDTTGAGELREIAPPAASLLAGVDPLTPSNLASASSKSFAENRTTQLSVPSAPDIPAPSGAAVAVEGAAAAAAAATAAAAGGRWRCTSFTTAPIAELEEARAGDGAGAGRTWLCSFPRRARMR
jgi:hypothetical protein